MTPYIDTDDAFGADPQPNGNELGGRTRDLLDYGDHGLLVDDGGGFAVARTNVDCTDDVLMAADGSWAVRYHDAT